MAGLSQERCYCGSSLSYTLCCQPFHKHIQIPMTPEALMRSRYSAYQLADIRYIQDTMRGPAAQGFDTLVAKEWAEQVQWLGLTVLQAHMTSLIEGQVEFIARFIDGRIYHRMHEISTFKLEQDRWFYIDGEQQDIPQQTLSRNTACPCGSKKKWKQCHGKQPKR